MHMMFCPHQKQYCSIKNCTCFMPAQRTLLKLHTQNKDDMSLKPPSWY